jgi:hypothetical protein
VEKAKYVAGKRAGEREMERGREREREAPGFKHRPTLAFETALVPGTLTI